MTAEKYYQQVDNFAQQGLTFCSLIALDKAQELAGKPSPILMREPFELNDPPLARVEELEWR